MCTSDWMHCVPVAPTPPRVPRRAWRQRRWRLPEVSAEPLAAAGGQSALRIRGFPRHHRGRAGLARWVSISPQHRTFSQSNLCKSPLESVVKQLLSTLFWFMGLIPRFRADTESEMGVTGRGWGMGGVGVGETRLSHRFRPPRIKRQTLRAPACSSWQLLTTGRCFSH